MTESMARSMDKLSLTHMRQKAVPRIHQTLACMHVVTGPRIHYSYNNDQAIHVVVNAGVKLNIWYKLPVAFHKTIKTSILSNRTVI